MGTAPFADLVRRRRSHRAYTRAALSNEDLSFLAWCTQGISDRVPDDETGTVHDLRTVPSAGARHPFETYVIVNRVAGIQPGLYRYLPTEHKLLPLLERDNLGWAVTTICYGQTHVGDAAAVFVWTAIPYRMEWRYGYIAHRMIAMEAGHVCQNLHLAAEAIGAGACAISGYDQGLMDKLINVDGREEFTIYLASVGKIEPRHIEHEGNKEPSVLPR